MTLLGLHHRNPPQGHELVDWRWKSSSQPVLFAVNCSVFAWHRVTEHYLKGMQKVFKGLGPSERQSSVWWVSYQDHVRSVSEYHWWKAAKHRVSWYIANCLISGSQHVLECTCSMVFLCHCQPEKDFACILPVLERRTLRTSLLCEASLVIWYRRLEKVGMFHRRMTCVSWCIRLHTFT